MARDTTTGTRNFSIFFLKKHNTLKEGLSESWKSVIWSINCEETGRISYRLSTVLDDAYIQFDYKTRSSWSDDEWKPMSYKFPLERVSCYFGGFRWYFRCTLLRDGVYCGRRVAILYSVGDYFACRHCADLSYDSCNESKKFRSWPFGILAKGIRADEMLEKVGYTHYRGRPTRKYRRYLRIVGQIGRQEDALSALNYMLGGGKMKKT